MVFIVFPFFYKFLQPPQTEYTETVPKPDPSILDGNNDDPMKGGGQNDVSKCFVSSHVFGVCYLGYVGWHVCTSIYSDD
jgi:hypothetical protein